ncbi:MAG TPA: DUF3857 domain-containing protein [Acidobacteriota bacterium]|nr:DUF3857 domain-containing protein [Acidobacteriota bacterium]
MDKDTVLQGSDDQLQVLGGRLPLKVRLSRRLGQGEVAGRMGALLVWISRKRIAFGNEWISQESGNDRFQIRFVAFRIPVKLTLTIHAPIDPGAISVQTKHGEDWRDVPFSVRRSKAADATKLSLHLQRLVVTSQLRVCIGGIEGHAVQGAIHVVKHPYADLAILVRALPLAKSGDIEEAEIELLRCLKAAPEHFWAADQLAQLYLDNKQYRDAQRWALVAAYPTDGRYGIDVLRQALSQDRGDLVEELSGLRSEAADWEIGGHHGTVCLHQDQHFWLGFGTVHFTRRRQIIEVRRQAAARLMRTLHFHFTQGREALVFARLQLVRGDGTVTEVSTEHLAIVDDPDSNQAIRVESRKSAIFHLPELQRGDCLELEHALISFNPKRQDGKPDFFIMADLNCEHPCWRSEVRIECPHDWDVTALGLNGAATPEKSEDDSEWRRFDVSGQRLTYDDWGTLAVERRYLSPHVCCGWADVNWQQYAAAALETQCHTPREEPLPAALAGVIADPVAPLEKLRCGFEWVRDRLKYMSLQSAKDRSTEPGLAEKIVAAGVGDCMDKSYLILLLARSLGFEAEYALVASEAGHLVTEIAGRQFDHIMVRVRVDDDWLYLDATVTGTPFGRIPPGLQGHAVLSLGPEPNIARVPEEDPSLNQISISELLDITSEGALTGAFEIEATGTPGSWWDDHCKSVSMTAPDPTRAGSVTLNRQLPSATLIDCEWYPFDAGEGRFRIVGRHRRRRLVNIRGRLIGFVDWTTPLVPIHLLKQRQWRDLAIFPIPMSYRFEVRIASPPGWEIEGSSKLTPIEGAFGQITTEEFCDGASLNVARVITVSRRFIEGPDVARIPEFLAAWEEALQLAFLLRPV